MVTADHGTDPTTESTDHSRERVPLLVAGPRAAGGPGHAGDYADLGATLCELLRRGSLPDGTSFAAELPGRRAQ
jgi:phosphopentomutase